MSKIVFSEVQGYNELTSKLEGRDVKTNPAVIYYCGNRTDGKSWCPDCVRSDEVLTEVLKEIEEKKLLNRDVELITCFVGDRPTWKDPENPARRVGITSIPTFTRLEGKSVSDPDVTAENIREFLVNP